MTEKLVPEHSVPTISPEDLLEKSQDVLEATTEKAEAFISWEFAIEAGIIVAALVLSWLGGKLLCHALCPTKDSLKSRWRRTVDMMIRQVSQPLMLSILLTLYCIGAKAAVTMYEKLAPFIHMEIAAGVAGISFAWVVVKLLSSLLPKKQISKWVAGIIWGMAALQILGWWEDTVTFLDSIGYTLSDDLRITLLTIIQAGVVGLVLLWLYGALSRLVERRVWAARELNPSAKVLVIKFSKIGLIFIAILLALKAVGLDLSTLAIFSGAAGLGLGFGMQKVFSNYISGIILLLDRSIKPGDVIGLDEVDSYGWVKSLSGRYVSLITRDGTEHLIPNEMLITEKVVNWSHSDRNVRIKIGVGISYDANPEEGMQILLDAAKASDRVLDDPKPVAHLIEFGDSSVNIELRCWINDPSNGIAPVRTAIMLDIWKRLKAAGIEIPFPQRDVHIRSHFSDSLNSKLS